MGWTDVPQPRIPAAARFCVQMRESGVGALFLFYGQFDIRLDDWGVDDLLEALEESRVPVFLCPINWRSQAMDATDWSNVVRICRKFPDLPVIVTENRTYKSQRAGYTALDVCPNFRFDLSSWWLRFINGSSSSAGNGEPNGNPGVPIMQLNYSDISPEELSSHSGLQYAKSAFLER